jgi:NAD(P)H-dependent flavin oxidoreductase YrpB (nitropropane dioxygenase family)
MRNRNLRTQLCDTFGIEFPIFAFSHCRDVVVAVSKAGGMGVMGLVEYSPEQLENELQQIDRALGGRPYGVNLIFPIKYEGDDELELAKQIPLAHREFIADLARRFHVPPLKASDVASRLEGRIYTHARARAHLEVALRHPVKLIVNALGPTPVDVVEIAHERGILIGGMVGSARHATKHVQSGADLVIAQGTEAAGHVGPITSMVLTPEVVDAVSPVPVLAAGGIGTGRQIAAALALGAAGVWMGSIWLTTLESDIDPEVKKKLLLATSADTVVSKCETGKPARQFRTAWIDAWQEPGAPDPLPTPLQGLLVRDFERAFYENHVVELMGGPVGQIVGSMRSVRSARDVVRDLVEECLDTLDRLALLQGAKQQG